jgi:hypothetical protein
MHELCSLTEDHEINTYVPSDLIKKLFLSPFLPLYPYLNSFQVEKSDGNTLMTSIFYAINKVNPDLFDLMYRKYYTPSPWGNNTAFRFENDRIKMNESFISQIKNLLLLELKLLRRKYNNQIKWLIGLNVKEQGSIIAAFNNPWDIEAEYFNMKEQQELTLRRKKERNEEIYREDGRRNRSAILNNNNQLDIEQNNRETRHVEISEDIHLVYMMREICQKNIPTNKNKTIREKNLPNFLDNLQMDNLPIMILLGKVFPQNNIFVKVGVYNESHNLIHISSSYNIFYSGPRVFNINCFIAIKAIYVYEQREQSKILTNQYEPLKPCDLRFTTDPTNTENKWVIIEREDKSLLAVIDRR